MGKDDNDSDSGGYSWTDRVEHFVLALPNAIDRMAGGDGFFNKKKKKSEEDKDDDDKD